MAFSAFSSYEHEPFSQTIGNRMLEVCRACHPLGRKWSALRRCPHNLSTPSPPFEYDGHTRAAINLHYKKFFESVIARLGEEHIWNSV
jgi:hypothetical protein